MVIGSVLSTVLWTLFLFHLYTYSDNTAFLPRPISANPVTEEEKLPDCMQLREEDPYPTSGEPLSGKNLCKAFTGTNRTVITEEEKLPDCMQLREEDPYPTSGEPLSGKNLCEAFTGTNRTDCVYLHPEIFHYVLFTNNPKDSVLGFREFLSIYSVDKFYKPEKIVIHCSQSITGKYWEMVQNLTTPIEMRLTDRITTIGKDKKKPSYISHEADYLKIKSGFRDGGIYSDFDVVILNGSKLREMQRQSEIVIGRDNQECTRTCAGFFSSVPGSPFMGKWLDSYENNYRPGWIDNAGHVPAGILHHCPECHRDITVDYHMSNWNDAAAKNWLKEGGLEWRQKAVAHYMNTGFMKPLKPPNELLSMSTPFSEMVKFVLGDAINDFIF